MGFSDNSLFSEYIKFCNYRKNAFTSGKLDLSEERWFYPTSILPLGVLMLKNPNLTVISPINSDVSNYFNIITNDDHNYIKLGSYIPLLKLPKKGGKKEKILDLFLKSEGEHFGGRNAFTFVVDELTDNVYQHSEFSTGYIMAQRYDRKKFTEIALIDDGISIPGTYEKAKYSCTDAEALNCAMRGITTKKEHNKERGFGLRSAINIIKEGLSGQCLIISRRGGLIATKDKNISYYGLDETTEFNGTLICIRVPYNREEIEIYDYIVS